MSKRWIILTLLVLAAAGPMSPRVVAQVGSNCKGELGNFWVPAWDQWMPLFDCSTEGPFLEICFFMTANCPPAAGASESCPTCAKASNVEGGSPISLASGNTYIKQVDVHVPGTGGGLTLMRTWNSLWPATQTASQVGLFGPNWRCNFEERLFVGSDNYLKYARGDGSFWSFGFAGFQEGVVTFGTAAPANTGATMAVSGPYRTITFTNGEKRNFDMTTGNLVQIIDRVGNTTNLSYDGVDRLSTVTDPAGRHLYFTYASGSSYLVTGVSSDFGISLTYAYDANGRMAQITKPDSSTIGFTYDANSYIISVVDSQNKVLEAHTYDTSGHGLSSTQANGVNSMTLTY